MLAIIETGGKQFIVRDGAVLDIPKLQAEEGNKVTFDKVLLLADEEKGTVQVGTPYVDGATIEADVQKQGRTRKIRVLKYKAKVRYRKHQGHRQHFTRVKVV